MEWGEIEHEAGDVAIRVYTEFQLMRFALFCLAWVTLLHNRPEVIDIATYTTLSYVAGLSILFHLVWTVMRLDRLIESCE